VALIDIVKKFLSYGLISVYLFDSNDRSTYFIDQLLILKY